MHLALRFLVEKEKNYNLILIFLSIYFLIVIEIQTKNKFRDAIGVRQDSKKHSLKHISLLSDNLILLASNEITLSGNMPLFLTKKSRILFIEFLNNCKNPYFLYKTVNGKNEFEIIADYKGRRTKLSDWLFDNSNTWKKNAKSN